MKFSEIKGYHEILDARGRKYRWNIEGGDFMVIIAPSTVMNFEHPNIACRVNAVFELKHYMVYGKKWTEKAGVDYMFVIPQDRIELIEQPGTSYVNVVINGTQYVLNVSGCTTKEGWEDNVCRKSHTCILKTKKQLKTLAEAALSPAEVLERGWGFDADIKRAGRFFELVAQPIVLKQLKADMQVVLSEGCRISGEYKVTGVNRHQRRIYTEHYYLKYNQINWTATAKQNHIEVGISDSYNRVGKLAVIEGNKYVA